MLAPHQARRIIPDQRSTEQPIKGENLLAKEILLWALLHLQENERFLPT